MIKIKTEKINKNERQEGEGQWTRRQIDEQLFLPMFWKKKSLQTYVLGQKIILQSFSFFE